MALKILDRYLLRQFLQPLGYCLAAFGMIIIVWDLFDHMTSIVAARTPPATLLLYYGCVLVEALEFLLPSCLLLATLYALWTMTRNNELIAMRAAGFSMIRIMAPFLGVGFLVSIAATFTNERITPSAVMWAKDLSSKTDQKAAFEPMTEKIVLERPYYHEAGNRQWFIDEFDMKKPNHFLGVEIRQEREDHTWEKVIAADRADWLDGQWWFHNPSVTFYDIRGEIRRDVTTVLPDLYEIRGFSERPSDIINDAKPEEYFTASEIARKLRQIGGHGAPEQHNAMKLRLHRRLALPWACLVVTLFGIPVGAKSARQSAVTALFLAIFCFLAYYLLVQVGTLLGTRGIVWPWLAAWLSNLVFMTVGSVMLVRMR